jgi:hypothetical protein
MMQIVLPGDIERKVIALREANRANKEPWVSYRRVKTVKLDATQTKQFLEQHVTVYNKVIIKRCHIATAIQSLGGEAMSRLDLFKANVCWFVSDVLKMTDTTEVEQCCMVLEREDPMDLLNAYVDHVTSNGAIGASVGLCAKNDMPPDLLKHIVGTNRIVNSVHECYSGVGSASRLLKASQWYGLADWLVDIEFDFTDMNGSICRRVVECTKRLSVSRLWICHHHSRTKEEMEGLEYLLTLHFNEAPCKDHDCILHPSLWPQTYRHQGGCTVAVQSAHGLKSCLRTYLGHSVIGFGLLMITFKW